MGLAHYRLRAQQGAIRSVGIAPPTPPSPTGTMLQTGAPDKLFSGAEMAANVAKIQEYNNFVYANSGYNGAGGYTTLPNGTVLRHKNYGVKCVIARNGGWMRASYPRETDNIRDPGDGSAPYDARRFPEHHSPTAPDYIDAAHQGPHIMNDTNGNFYEINYGEEIEFAVRFRVPLGTSECSTEGWQDCTWWIVAQLETSKTISSEGLRVTLSNSYNEQNRNKIQVWSSRSTSSTKTMNPPALGAGVVFTPNVWQEIRVLGCVDNTSGKKGWFRSWLDGDPYMSADNFQSGNSSGGTMRFGPQYHDYNPAGPVAVHIDRFEIRKTGRSGTGSSFPAAP